jgi:hypothetical protein
MPTNNVMGALYEIESIPTWEGYMEKQRIVNKTKKIESHVLSVRSRAELHLRCQLN